MTLYHPSIETYQKDISYKFHIIYFINISNQIITIPNYQNINFIQFKSHLLIIQRMITIQLPIYNKLRIESNNITNVVRDLISFYRNLPFD